MEKFLSEMLFGTRWDEDAQKAHRNECLAAAIVKHYNRVFEATIQALQHLLKLVRTSRLSLQRLSSSNSILLFDTRTFAQEIL